MADDELHEIRANPADKKTSKTKRLAQLLHKAFDVFHREQFGKHPF